jgi:AraC-like DNA-binding protein
VIRHLGALVVRIIAKLREHSSYRANDLLLNAIESQLLGAITELLVSTSRCVEHDTPRKRFLACRRALRHAEKLKRPISVDELADQAGVSRRALELGFRETLDISPQRYLRYVRLNGLHRDLRRALSGQTTVTEAATHWGFVELGRTAGEYRELFGESPSMTLARSGRLDCRRLADALTFSASRTGS